MTQASSQANAVSKVVRDALGVNPAYRHVPKRVTAGQPVTLSLALLKWYELFPVDRPVPEEISRAARRAVESDVKVEGLGFVVLHRCGGDFYFLITNTWRNENELWETVWYKDGDAMVRAVPPASAAPADVLRVGAGSRLEREGGVGAVPRDRPRRGRREPVARRGL